MIVSIINPQGVVSYTRPHDHPDVQEAFRTEGYTVWVIKGHTEFAVSEIIDGHIWGQFSGPHAIPGECCRICGMMRRRDKLNKPCKGPVEVTLR